MGMLTYYTQEALRSLDKNTLKSAFGNQGFSKDYSHALVRAHEFKQNTIDMGMLSGSIDGVLERGIALANTVQETAAEKAKDSKHWLHMTLEDMREQMLADLDDTIAALRGQIEKDQEELNRLQDKSDQLTTLRLLIESGQFDPTNPEHRALFEGTDVLENAGVESIEEFAELDPEGQKDAIDNDLDKTNDAIAELVERIEDNLRKMDALERAKHALREDNPDIAAIRADLEAAGINLEDVGADELTVGTIKGMSSTLIEDLDDFEIEDIPSLSVEEQAEFIRQARLSDDISEDKLEIYEDTISEEARRILENTQQPTSPLVVAGL